MMPRADVSKIPEPETALEDQAISVNPAARMDARFAFGRPPSTPRRKNTVVRGLMCSIARARLFIFQSIRYRILGVATCITVVVYAAISGILIVHARTATRIEITRALDATEQLVVDAADQGGGREGAFIKELARGLVAPRHVAISVLDHDGKPVLFANPAPTADRLPSDWDPAPGWFYRLIAAKSNVRSVVVHQDGAVVGTIVLASRPDDEIAEAWANFRSFAGIGAIGIASILLILGAALGELLAPLTKVSQGLETLEAAEYAVRLPRSSVKELDVISSRFNALASALATARKENTRLGCDLVSLQDEERRHLAMELHDEFGPCLFGIKVYTDSLEFLVASQAPALASRVKDRTLEIMAVVDRLNAINRSIMRRLRPMALGKMPLSDLLSDLADDFRSKAPNVSVVLSFATSRPSFGERTDLTVYRCVQEGIANALKHADPRVVEVSVLEHSVDSLVVEICDDGVGLAPDARQGYGLTGMRDRVKAIGGSIKFDRALRGGTAVSICLPLRLENDCAPESPEVGQKKE